MLQSPPLSKIYGHGHIKKFWLMQNQKESEGKALVASSSASPCRHGSNPAGLGHESKQGPQFSLGNDTIRSPSAVSVRSAVSGPTGFNMIMARHASLVTCAESLSPPLCTDQTRSLLPPSSPSITASISKEENHLAEYDDHILVSSPCGGDEVSAFSQFDSAFHRAGDALYSYPPTSKDVFDSSKHDRFCLSKDRGQDNTFLQERFNHVESSKFDSHKSISLEPYRCSMGMFSNSDSSSPFTVPFQLPENYFLEAKGRPFDQEPVGEFSDRSNLVPSPVSSLLDCGPGEREFSEMVLGANGMRTCSVCGTSKTPLWRSGPKGPKSLCNACGIRFKKTKRNSGENSASPLPSQQPMKKLLKAAKRKQDTPPASSEPIGTTTSGLASQVVKKRKGSKLMKKGECVTRKCEVTGSSGESSLTWNLHSPSAVSSPSVAHFERLSIDESVTALDMVAGEDEEEAAMLLMYISCGLVFA